MARKKPQPQGWLDPQWKTIAYRAWSMWGMFLATILGGLEIFVQIGGNVFDAPPLLFAIFAMLVTIASMLARLLNQSNLPGG